MPCMMTKWSLNISVEIFISIENLTSTVPTATIRDTMIGNNEKKMIEMRTVNSKLTNTNLDYMIVRACFHFHGHERFQKRSGFAITTLY